MSKKKEIQWLYKFTVDKEVQVSKTEEQEVNGEKVKVTKTVTEKHPVSFAIRKPNRRLHEAADTFYGINLSQYIKDGFLTKALLLKRYRNDGGALSDPDMAYFEERSAKLHSVETEYQKAVANIDKKSDAEREALIKDLLTKKQALLEDLQSIESINQSLFAYTAESKAANKLNTWWIVFLSYWDENGGDNFVEYLNGTTYEEKVASWDEKVEDEDQLFEQVAARLSFLVGLWNAGASTEEEFRNGELELGFSKIPQPAKSAEVEIPKEVNNTVT